AASTPTVSSGAVRGSGSGQPGGSRASSDRRGRRTSSRRPRRGGALATASLARGVRWGGGEAHGGAEPACGPRGEAESSVVRLGDALDDREAEAHATVVGADSLAAALEGLGERGDELGGELLAGVLDREHRTRRVRAGPD